MKITICLPTYKRADLFEESLMSCLAQTLLPDEIIIGDNSPDNNTQDKLAELAARSAVPIKYLHHVPGLSPAQNVETLFNQVTTELLLLLHDDDLLLPTCLHDLHACFVADDSVDVAFGKQYIMSAVGQVDYPGSEKWNKLYYKTTDYDGQVLSNLESAILQQFPNNSYLIRTSIAQKLGYTSFSVHACDFEFGLSLALHNYRFQFKNVYTTKARLSDASFSRNYDNDSGLMIYKQVKQLAIPTSSLKYKEEVLNKYVSIALAQSANLKRSHDAREIFFDKWHWRNRSMFTIMKGVYHLLRAHL